MEGGMEMRKAERKELEILQNQVNKISKKQESESTKLVRIKFIGVEFDYDKVQTGENKVNEALVMGYVVIDNFKTESGLVMVMGKYEKEKEIRNHLSAKTMEEYR